MVERDLKDYFCPTCKRKVFRGSFIGVVQIKCQGCKSIVNFAKRVVETSSSKDREKLDEKRS